MRVAQKAMKACVLFFLRSKKEFPLHSICISIRQNKACCQNGKETQNALLFVARLLLLFFLNYMFTWIDQHNLVCWQAEQMLHFYGCSYQIHLMEINEVDLKTVNKLTVMKNYSDGGGTSTMEHTKMNRWIHGFGLLVYLNIYFNHLFTLKKYCICFSFST